MSTFLTTNYFNHTHDNEQITDCFCEKSRLIGGVGVIFDLKKAV